MNAALRLSTRRVLRDTQADDGGTGLVAVGLLRAGGLGNVQVVDRQTDRQTVASRLIDGEHVAPGVGTPIGGGGAGRRAPVSSL